MLTIKHKTMQRPTVNILVDWEGESYTECSEDLIDYLKKYMQLNVVTASIFDDVIDIFLSEDLEKIKNISYEK